MIVNTKRPNEVKEGKVMREEITLKFRLIPRFEGFLIHEAWALSLVAALCVQTLARGLLFAGSHRRSFGSLGVSLCVSSLGEKKPVWSLFSCCTTNGFLGGEWFLLVWWLGYDVSHWNWWVSGGWSMLAVFEGLKAMWGHSAGTRW